MHASSRFWPVAFCSGPSLLLLIRPHFNGSLLEDHGKNWGRGSKCAAGDEGRWQPLPILVKMLEAQSALRAVLQTHHFAPCSVETEPAKTATDTQRRLLAL